MAITSPVPSTATLAPKPQTEREGMEWRDTTLLTDDNEPNYDAVADVAAEYCFVR